MTAAATLDPAASARPRWLAVLHSGENAVLVAALVAMLLIPVVELGLRSLADVGISGSAAIVQHLMLVVGMVGGAIAAREGRLLTLAPAQTFLKGRLKTLAHIASGSATAVISGVLCVASWRYVQAMRPLHQKLAYDVPVWTVQVFLPLGFGLIAARVLWRTGTTWRGRLAALAPAAALLAAVWWLPLDTEWWTTPALLSLAAATLLGAPIFAALGGTALILFWGRGHGFDVQSVPLKHYGLVTNDTLPSFPLFTLAGYFLAEGGASKRIVRVFQALTGWLRGGPAVVTALACAFFTTFTGASGVTILALGGVLMPVLLAAKYSERNALGLLTGAGSLGMLFPPCLPLILYAIVANQSANAGLTLGRMFLGGLGPGLLLLALTVWWGVLAGPKDAAARIPFRLAEARAALWAAKWELLIPVVALGALATVPTTVEAAAITAAYAMLVTTVLHRDLHPLRDLPRVVKECGLLVGGVLLILGVALGFTHWLVVAQIPDQLVEWATVTIKSKWLFLLGLNVVLLLVGGVVEIYAAIVVVVPLLVPVGTALGIDPVHLGIIFLANMELGFLAPPIGLNLLLASYRFDKPVMEVNRAVLPMLGVLFLGVLLITYFPPLTTFLPRLFASP
jgi:C4-dicarboxylate transporter DctM subunit